MSNDLKKRLQSQNSRSFLLLALALAPGVRAQDEFFETPPDGQRPPVVSGSTEAESKFIGASRQSAGALTGRVVFTSGGHGWTWGREGWFTQRGVGQEINEDYGNLDQMNFFVPYAFNSGAAVVAFRPIGYQTNEIVPVIGFWSVEVFSQSLVTSAATLLTGCRRGWRDAPPSDNPDNDLVTVRIFIFRGVCRFKYMALRLNKLSMPIQRCVLRKGARVFALLGKATPFGLAPFNRHDVGINWALTAEFGCLRLERLVGDEEVSGTRLFLPTVSCYDYGVGGPGATLEVAKSVFGLLSFELEQLINVVRKGNVPMLGFSHTDLRCSISTCVIPGYWPHVVISNLASYGNVVSLETFMRIMVSSLPQGRLAVRYPGLQPLLTRMNLLVSLQRPGIPYSTEMMEFAPAAPQVAAVA